MTAETARQMVVALSDAQILDIALNHVNSPSHIMLTNLIGPETNPRWITGEAIEIAYDRDLIDEVEQEYLCRKCGL